MSGPVDTAHRRELRELRGSIIRLTVSLRSGQLSAAELAMGERTLHRLRTALAKAERRGKVGRPRKAQAIQDEKRPDESDKTTSAVDDDLRWLGTRRKADLSQPKVGDSPNIQGAPPEESTGVGIESSKTGTPTVMPQIPASQPLLSPQSVGRGVSPEMLLQCLHFGVAPAGAARFTPDGRPITTDPLLMTFIATGEVPKQPRLRS
jgi:hypothetical protein